MKKEEDIRVKIKDCIDNLKEFSDKEKIGGHDFIVADRNITTLSALLWVLEEAPPDEVKHMADSVMKKFKSAM